MQHFPLILNVFYEDREINNLVYPRLILCTVKDGRDAYSEKLYQQSYFKHINGPNVVDY
jgi:hypothetical protein